MRTFLLTSIVLLTLSSLSGQIYIGNFFGPDSDEINGTFNYEIPLGFPIPVKKFDKNDTKITIGPYYTFSETFFSDPWVFTTDGTETVAFIDEEPSRIYSSALFRHKSKIRSWSWQLKIGVQTTVKNLGLSLEYIPTFLQVGSFRRRYTEGNEVIKTRDRFRDKADFYNINRFQHRIYGSVSLYGVGIGAYFNLTPFFKEGLGPEINKFGVTLVIRDNIFDFGGEKGKDGKDGNTPEAKQMKF